MQLQSNYRFESSRIILNCSFQIFRKVISKKVKLESLSTPPMIHLESKMIIQQFNSRDPQNILIFNQREANPEFIFGPMGWTVPNQTKNFRYYIFRLFGVLDQEFQHLMRKRKNDIFERILDVQKIWPKYQKCFEANSGEPKFMIFSFPALILTMSWSILGSSSDWLRYKLCQRKSDIVKFSCVRSRYL